jgi:hypothetical protein
MRNPVGLTEDYGSKLFPTAINQLELDLPARRLASRYRSEWTHLHERSVEG